MSHAPASGEAYKDDVDRSIACVLLSQDMMLGNMSTSERTAETEEAQRSVVGAMSKRFGISNIP